MKTIKIFMLVLMAVALSSCASHVDVTSLDPEKKCPPDEQCFSIISGGMDAEGGGVVKAGFLIGGTTTIVDKNGELRTVKNNAQSIVAGINPDRVDTLGGHIIGSATQFGVVKIQADAMKDSAKIQADAAKNAAPGFVLINSAYGGSSSSGSSSGAIAMQTTDVQTNQSQGMSSGSGPKILDPNK